MDKITVKICGLKTETDVEMCMEMGVDILGFVTEYPIDVPWNLSRRETKKLLSLVGHHHKTCIVTGGKAEDTIALAEYLRPSLVQLHFNETFEDTIQIIGHLKPLGIGVIKTMPLTEKECKAQFGTTDTASVIRALSETGLFGILVDSRTPQNVYQIGNKMDTGFFNKIRGLSSKPVILAGGITPENVQYMIRQTKTRYIDVMTGVEKRRGEKDRVRLAELLSHISHLLT